MTSLQLARAGLLALGLITVDLTAHNAASAEASRGPAAELLKIEDLYSSDAPRSVVLSPDGRRAAYVRRWLDPLTKLEHQCLWLSTGCRDVRPLEANHLDARSPVFSPDGKWIAFVSSRPRPAGWKQTPPAPGGSEPATDIWLIPSAGGSSLPLAGPDKPYGRVFNDGFYGRIAFSPDGRRLVFVADDGTDPRTPEEIAADVTIVRPDQGEGYTGYGPAQVWVADLTGEPARFAAGRIDRLTRDDAWYGDPQWSPDGRTVVVHANRTADREAVRYSINKDYDLWALDVRTHAIQRLTSGPGPEVSPRFSPDGKRLACLSIPRKGSHMDVFNLAIVTLGKGGARTRVLFDHHGPGADDPPHPAPSFPLPDECWDGPDHLIYNAALRTESPMIRVDLRTGQGSRLVIPAARDGRDFAANTTGWRIRHRHQLTPHGDAYLAHRLLAKSRVVRWTNGAGRLIEGILTVPPAPAASPPYKLVVYPHGGPHSRSARGFDFTVQIFAAQGYAVFQPNFRGSAGYGQKFVDADRFDFGDGDMSDILAGIDALIAQGLVDRDHQFLYGVSYGGFLTCWLIGHTTQFRAAVAQNAVTDLAVMWGLSDLQSWTEWEFGGFPWQVPRALRDHSPMTFAADVRTPTLILHSREDRRCPLALGRMFYRALLARKVPTEMVIYPNEGHGISQPRHQEDVLRRTLAWFRKYDGCPAMPPASAAPAPLRIPGDRPTGRSPGRGRRPAGSRPPVRNPPEAFGRRAQARSATPVAPAARAQEAQQ